MKLINNNLKKAGYFNSLLILICIVLNIINIFNVPIYIKIDSIVCIIALIFGLFYSLNGYIKNAAKYYKAFIFMFLISSVFSFIASISGGDNNYLIVASNVAILLSIVILAFVKDLGEKKSNSFAITILLLNAVKICAVIITKSLSLAVRIHLSNFVLACILCVFVSAKYKDKESRGAK